MTYQELQESIEMGKHDGKVPSVNYLKESSTIVASRRLGYDTSLVVFRNGFAVYGTGRHKTVFPVWACGDYAYKSSTGTVYIQKDFFDKQAWYMRLILEGEDRLSLNEDIWEKRKCISYDVFSDGWALTENTETPMAEQIIQKETVREMLDLLTEKQRLVVSRLYFWQETRKEVAEGLGVTEEAVRRILERAVKNLRKKYQNECFGCYCGKEVISHAW